MTPRQTPRHERIDTFTRVIPNPVPRHHTAICHPESSAAPFAAMATRDLLFVLGRAPLAVIPLALSAAEGTLALRLRCARLRDLLFLQRCAPRCHPEALAEGSLFTPSQL